MATNISVRISRNPYGMPGARFETSFAWNGLTNRYQFDNRFQLAQKLVDDSTEQVVIDEVMDALDATEWGEQPVYPLGVVYVGEAVCDFGELDPVYANVRHASEPSPYWKWAAATLRIGAVTAPWVLLMLAGRVVWGWL